MDREDVIGVQARAVRGVFRLGGRELAVKLVQLAGGIALARELPPTTFGLFVISYFALNLFAIFSELGLGAAYIRTPGRISQEELDSLFTFQLGFVCALSSFLFLAAPLIASLYRAADLVLVLRALSLSLLLVSLRTVPIVMSERKLSYGPIALSDVVRHTTFWVIAVGGALVGFGIWSLVAAVIASAGAAALVLSVSTGWRPRLRFDLAPIRRSARFGLLYQGQTLTHFAKDNMVPALGGMIYGSAAVGLLAWAQQLTAVPLALTGLVARVSYPALAKFQGDRIAFAEMLESTLRWTCRLTFPLFAVLIPLTPSLIGLVYGRRWLPATASVYLFYVNMVLGVGTGVLMPALYSIGRAKIGLRISIGWMLSTWLAALGLAATGMKFEAIASAYIVGTVAALVFIVHEVRKFAPIRLVSAVTPSLLAGVALGCGIFVIAPRLVHGIVSLVAVATLGFTAGITVNVWSGRAAVLRSLSSLRQQPSPDGEALEASSA